MRGIALALAVLAAACTPQAPSWTDAERAQIAALSLDRLGPPPPDPGNAHGDDPAAAALGARLFADPHLSANGKVACASCHEPARAFTDGRATAQGLGTTRRNAPSLVGAAWSPWLFWDGRADSLWAQATGPLMHADEMGMDALRVARVIGSSYGTEYAAVFGAQAVGQDVRRVFTNAAKALAAYVRTLRPRPARFDAFARALAAHDPAAATALSATEQAGLRLFLGKGLCLRCHNGPLFTNHQFHNTGLAPPRGQPPDPGRARGVELALASDYSCRGAFSDAADHKCPALDYARTGAPELVGAFKTPTLRNLALTGPYMHDGRFATLREVLDHYNKAPQLLPGQGHTELVPLSLSESELAALEAFLRTLGPLASGVGQD